MVVEFAIFLIAECAGDLAALKVLLKNEKSLAAIHFKAEAHSTDKNQTHALHGQTADRKLKSPMRVRNFKCLLSVSALNVF